MGHGRRQYFRMSSLVNASGSFEQKADRVKRPSAAGLFIVQIGIDPPEFIRFTKGQGYVWKGFHNGSRGLVHELQCPDIIWFSELVVFRKSIEIES